MSKYKSCSSFDMLEDKVKTYITDEQDLELITKAYKYAYDKHFGQKRLTGEDYITHPLSAAYILTSIQADASTISGALLHDVFETGDVDLEEFKQIFGEDILSIVQGVTKINKLNFSGDSESVINNQRKILVGLSEDVRVIIIKLADRLHNMKTLFVLDEKKQKETAKEYPLRRQFKATVFYQLRNVFRRLINFRRRLDKRPGCPLRKLPQMAAILFSGDIYVIFFP